MKWKRSERLVDMTRHLLEYPHELIPLTFFSERYKSAKSSISEDLTIVKETFEEKGTGKLMTVSGAAGGVKFIPKTAEAEVREVVSLLMEELGHSDRLVARRIFVYDRSSWESSHYGPCRKSVCIRICGYGNRCQS